MAKTALLLMDMQNAIINMAGGDTAFVGKVKQAREAARKGGIPVIYVASCGFKLSVDKSNLLEMNHPRPALFTGLIWMLFSRLPDFKINIQSFVNWASSAFLTREIQSGKAFAA